MWLLSFHFSGSIIFQLIYLGFLSVILSSDTAFSAFCPAEKNIVVWEDQTYAKNHAESNPLCLDEYKLPIYRNCTENGWEPLVPPDCTFTQQSYELSTKCQPGYEYISFGDLVYCRLITQPQPWNNTCLYSGISPYSIHHYSSILDIQSTVWYPARKLSRYGPVVWTIPGETDDIDLIALISDDDYNYEEGCLSFSPTTGIARVEDCNNEYPIFCAGILDAIDEFACPDDSYSMIGHQENCYSIKMIPHTRKGISKFREISEMMNWVSLECDGDLFVIDSVEKTRLFKLMADRLINKHDRCLFGVSHNVYIENFTHFQNVSESIQYVNWDVPPDIQNGILVINSEGKWNFLSNEDTISCIACERSIQIEKPKMVLNFYENIGELHLTIYNERSLYKANDNERFYCYTDCDYDLRKVVKVKDKLWSGHLIGENNIGTSEEKVIYELKLYSDGPGYYWCEGYDLLNFTLITTRKIVAYERSDDIIYAMLINVNCGSNCGHLSDSGVAKVVAKDFKKFLEQYYKIYCSNFKISCYKDKLDIDNVRLMFIESINILFNVAKIIFHVTISVSEGFDDDILDGGISSSIDSDVILTYNVRKFFQKMMLSAVYSSPTYHFISMNSTQYCLPEISILQRNLTWLNGRIGEIVAPQELCIMSNGLPSFRKCLGNFHYGGYWQNISNYRCNHNNLTHITNQLYNLSQSEVSPNNSLEIITELRQLFHNQSKSLISADFFYAGLILRTISAFSEQYPVIEKVFSENLFQVFNSLLSANETISTLSAILNSTNVLLDAFDSIVNGVSQNVLISGINRGVIFQNVSEGTIWAHTEKMIIYLIDPTVVNISGIALYRNSTASNGSDFSTYITRPLYMNQSYIELMEEDNLELATFVPKSLLDRLHETQKPVQNQTTPIPPVRIAITIYYNDVLFKEPSKIVHSKSNSKIVSVSIPGYRPYLPELIPILMKSNANVPENTTDSNVCGYWNFKMNPPTWSRDGCEFYNKSSHPEPIIVCACSHLTHFSNLVLGTYIHSVSSDDNVVITESHQGALDLITLLGCSLSLLGISGIAVTAILFKVWREKPSTKVLLQLSAAISLQMILLCFVNTEVVATDLILYQKWSVCVALGALLHYSVLVVFCWMLITAYLQFMRYVRVLGHKRSSRFILKSFFFGWGVPLIPVGLVLLITPHSYIPSMVHWETASNSGICYPSGTALHFGVILPIGITIAVNLTIFVLVVYNIIRGPDGKLRANERDLTLSQLRLSTFLFFLLGLTWIFGFLASTKAGLVFSYLFCLTATLQGFILFVYFVVLDPITRHLWYTFLRKYILCDRELK